MGFVNMGWGVQCDNCQEWESDSIFLGTSRTKSEVKDAAKHDGWIIHQTLTFCSKRCKERYLEQQEQKGDHDEPER